MKIKTFPDRKNRNLRSITIILLAFFLHAPLLWSQTGSLSFSLRNANLRQLFDQIESKSEVMFSYKDITLDDRKDITLTVKDESVESILNKVLAKKGLTYTKTGNTFAIKPNTVAPAKVGEEKKITGTVVDEHGEPIIGANVVEKGTTNGVVTDIDGYFNISVSNNAVLQISYIGYMGQEIHIKNQSNLQITLREDSQALEEVVVVGYGTIRKKDLTGAVASVSGSSLKDIPVSSAAEAITGRMAGVQVTKTEGSPDAEMRIRVRGGGSITQDNSPLFIVDGFPVDNMNDIAPTDITSIDILKDASSTAIYGARGANGVVLITTKEGYEGKGKVSYNTYFGIKKITQKLDVLNPYEYVFWQYEHDKISTYGKYENYYGVYDDINLYKQLQGTNWQEELFGRTGTSQYHNVAVSGGSKISRYNISLTRNDEKEIMLGSGYERTNLNIKTTNKVKNWLSLDLNIRFSDMSQKGAGTNSNSRLAHAVQYRPTNGLSDYVDEELVSADDYEANLANNKEPVKQTQDDYRRLNDQVLNLNGAATIEFTKNLKYRFEYGTLHKKVTNKRFYGINTSNVNEYGGNPMANITKTDINSYRLANVLTYSKKNFLPKSNLTITLGEELNYYKSESVLNSSKYFPKYIDAVSALSMMQLGTPDPTETSDNPANKISSFFGRMNYDYDGKYLATVTFRADGSSKFAKGNQWGYFPSVALAWRISDEPFMHKAESWLSDLKIRTSYGQSGNNRISDNAWRKTFSVSTGNLYMNEEPTAFLAPNSVLSNPKLKWETTETNNLGIDFGLFKHRLSGSFEVYKNKTKDLLISATVPSSTGYSTQWQNIGQTSNKGLEITLNGVLVDKKDFYLSASFNIAFNKNRIDKLGEAKEWEQTSMWYGWIGTGTIAGDYLIREGGQVGEMYGYITDGMYTFDDFNYDSETQVYTLKEGVPDNQALTGVYMFAPGALKFKNLDDDPIVNEKDKTVIGNANPKHTGGLNLTARYKGFDLSAFFNWVYGNDIYNANKLVFTSAFAYRFRNLLTTMNSDDRFTYVDKATGQLVYDQAKLQEINRDAKIWSSGMRTLQLHSWAVEDGSFLRLNTLTLGYTLPQNLLNKIGISRLRVYAVGYNLWTWTNYSGYDPEVDVARRTPLTPGVDWCAYPRSRSYSIGLNLEF